MNRELWFLFLGLIKMFKVQFETLEEIETGAIVSGFFGDKKVTEEKWIAKEADVVCGGQSDSGYTLIRFNDTEYGFLDLIGNEKDDDGVMTLAYRERCDSWRDIRNLKILKS